jgi:hypothetical protein
MFTSGELWFLVLVMGPQPAVGPAAGHNMSFHESKAQCEQAKGEVLMLYKQRKQTPPRFDCSGPMAFTPSYTLQRDLVTGEYKYSRPAPTTRAN